MSEVQEEAGAETTILTRTFGLDVQEAGSDGRTIHVRVVPFDEVATVSDPPDFRPYKEQFMPGVFARNEKAPNRVWLRADHEMLSNGQRRSGNDGVVGKGVTLVSTSTGYEGEFRFLDTPDALTTRELVLNGGYDGVSAEFLPIKNNVVGGVTQRQAAHLDSVALAREPAYANAKILAMREQSMIVDESMLPPPPNLAIVERCAELGIDLPEGMAILLARAYTEQPWDGSASRWDTPEAYCSAAAIDLNQAGGAKTKDRCHLPFKEPGSGAINVNGVKAALSRIGQGYPQDATQAQRDAAKARLEKILTSFNSTSQ